MSAKPAQTVAELADRIAASRAAAPARPERQFRHAVRGEEARQGRRGNGGPDLDEPEPRMLRHGAAEVMRVATAMFGRRWKAELAEALGEHDRQIRRWASGESAPDARARTWLLAEARRHRAELDAAIVALAHLEPIPPAPADPEPEPEPEVTLAPGVDPDDAAWFLAGLARALPPGRPTFVREVLSARRPPRGRHWTAEVRVFDGARHTLDCDRGADLQGNAVGLAWIPGEGITSRQPCILWDDETGWLRGADFVRGSQPRPAPAAPARPDADPRQVDIEDLLADAGLLGN
ncbi:hypothetical protein [Methylorubrum populi]|uniref:Uncharacterized protein n=1 Tax=Methylorubrum populi TaxID=223967 RepID=A0A833N369_9HYPH|nr:hypothetical protein [Methylorubrum populi]KAB7785369.1 hypothetical protein F8B43_1870 [Methylorubrum populi]